MSMEWALDKTGAHIHIREVKSGDTAICPGCGGLVFAKKGEMMSHHFSHMPGAECSFGGEGVRHKLAKKCIEEATRILLPKAEKVLDYQKISIEASYLNYNSSDVIPEFYIGGDNPIRVDEVIQTDNRKIGIEIMVTHRTDRDKSKILARNNLEAIEIIIEDDKEITPDYVCFKAPRRWLFNHELAKRIIEHFNARKQIIKTDIAFQLSREKAKRLIEEFQSDADEPFITESEKKRSLRYISKDVRLKYSPFTCNLSVIYAIISLKKERFEDIVSDMISRGFIKGCSLPDNKNYHDYLREKGIEMSAERYLKRIFREVRS